MTKDDAIKKIKKCPRMVGSSNPTESATAWRQAQALMDSLGLTENDIAALDVNKVAHGALVKDNPTEYETFLAQKVASQFSCCLLFSVGRLRNGRGDWLFIGVGSKPELAEYAFEVLLRQLKKDRGVYRKTKLGRFKPQNRVKLLGQFSSSWVFAAVSKLADIEPSASERNAISAYIEINHKALQTLTNRKGNDKLLRGSDNAVVAGYNMGNAAQVNAAVNGGKSTQQLGLF